MSFNPNALAGQASGGDLTRSLADSLYAPHMPKTIWTVDPRNCSQQSSSSFFSRVVWPMTGTIDRLAIFCTATSATNAEMGVYDTSATTRNRLATTGAVALTASTYAVGTISLAVVGGDSVDLGYAMSNGSGSAAGASYNNGSMPLLPSGFMPVSLGGAPRLSYFVSGLTSLSSTILESNMSLDTFNPLVIARYV